MTQTRKRTLLLLRHAKSSWSNPDLDDHDRPLNARGRQAASLIGNRLSNQMVELELVICSTSVRTRETAKLVFAEFKNPPPISYAADLYHATDKEIGGILRRLGESTRCTMLIGHNPGFEDFLANLTGEIVQFPTAGLAQIELNVEHWTAFDDQVRGRLVELWRPKEIA